MKQGEWAVYSIEASGCHSQVAVQSVMRALSKYNIPGQYLRIAPYVAEKEEQDGQLARPARPGYVTVPRLFTQWRGDEAEEAWQSDIRKAVQDHAEIVTIHAEPWQMLPGYPQGAY